MKSTRTRCMDCNNGSPSFAFFRVSRVFRSCKAPLSSQRSPVMMSRWLAAIFLVALVVAPTSAGEVDRFLPPDSEFMVAVQVKHLLEAPIVKQNLLEPARQGLNTIDEIETTLKDLG